jgi:hypothetical protein
MLLSMCWAPHAKQQASDVQAALAVLMTAQRYTTCQQCFVLIMHVAVCHIQHIYALNHLNVTGVLQVLPGRAECAQPIQSVVLLSLQAHVLHEHAAS